MSAHAFAFAGLDRQAELCKHRCLRLTHMRWGRRRPSGWLPAALFPFRQVWLPVVLAIGAGEVEGEPLGVLVGGLLHEHGLVVAALLADDVCGPGQGRVGDHILKVEPQGGLRAVDVRAHHAPVLGLLLVSAHLTLEEQRLALLVLLGEEHIVAGLRRGHRVR
eukprot:CAMPEP_0206009378 /NCGR_PEP_ID=MMETSP1464-20131121/9593_1 /ASSEMBLY_ACC=CAM_ASM_001124 /TAXON_ID=119497 /ORGANISM="Exanthemachrysis gayraliae, Strain RCC1523" /LENGTH=162 /DNA_ID=CAMNT_0053382975 /DNA_START=171 /DNA_END=655 /DNA_ORIENTATION=+